MHLRQQALIVVLAAASLASGGCARLLGAFLAPQEAAIAAAQQVGNRISAPVQSDLARMDREVGRLLQGDGGDRSELQRIQQELDRLDPAKRPREGSAQDEDERLRPWHPRASPEPIDRTMGRRGPAGDAFVLARQSGERGLPASGALPDGIPAAELRAPVDRSRVRVESRR